MSLTQKIVPPAAIESELLRIWEGLVKESKMRASLFNLIVFNRFSARTDYIRNIVQKIVEKFPCRVLFISEDPDPNHHYLKTAVSVIMPHASSHVACDNIDIGASGDELERVPYLIWSHILPDLPTTLLWAEDPSQDHPLFAPLSRLAHRIIFDSEAADSLFDFATTSLALKEKSGVDIADLNWARTEGWRDLFSSVFNSADRVRQLQSIQRLQIIYNSRITESFCHLKVQSMYLLGWIAARLNWDLQSSAKNLSFCFLSDQQNIEVKIDSECWEGLGSGTIIGAELETTKGDLFHFRRIQERYHSVCIEISSPEKCELPYQFLLGQTATGQSLVQEICMKGSSAHYLEMLRYLLALDRDRLC
jgi:glucose-6-phosphate dehydrogenase assembly protein OpcA